MMLASFFLYVCFGRNSPRIDSESTGSGHTRLRTPFAGPFVCEPVPRPPGGEFFCETGWADRRPAAGTARHAGAGGRERPCGRREGRREPFEGSKKEFRAGSFANLQIVCIFAVPKAAFVAGDAVAAGTQGLMAEWLGKGLQNLVQRFESASDLKTIS